MRLKLIFISLSISFYYSLSAQESPFANGFDKGFKEGYCYNRNSVSCQPPLTPLTPLPRLNENQNNYSDGYNRGFQTGLDLQRLEGGLGTNSTSAYQAIPNYRFNDYILQLPVDAMANVLIYKQKLYDARANWIQQRINDMIDLAYSLVYQFSSDDYQNLVNQQTQFFKENIEGKNIDWADNYMFNQIKGFFNSQERNIYSTYNNLIYQANSQIVNNNLRCNGYQTSIFIIKQNNHICFSTSQNLKDSLNISDFDFSEFEYSPNTNDGIFVFYSKISHAYYKVSDKEYTSLMNNTTMRMEFVTNCNTIYFANISQKTFAILDEGNYIDFNSLGVNIYKTSQGNYSKFFLCKDNSTNKLYFIPFEIYVNPIKDKIYPIDSR